MRLVMRLTLTIDSGDISPERLEEYKKELNALIGCDAEWEIVRTETAQEQPNASDCNVNEELPYGGI